MVIYDQLRVSDDGKQLFVDAHINTVENFDHIYMDNITIYAAGCQSDAPPEVPSDNSSYIYRQKLDGELRELHLMIDELILKKAQDNVVKNPDGSISIRDNTKPYATEELGARNFSSHLFFVIIQCAENGEANPCFICLPCSMQDMNNLAVTFDENLLYQQVMDYSKELLSDCTVPQGFTDFILLWNAFKAAVETEHYIPALKFFKMLFCKGRGKGRVVNGKSKGCGCRG